MNIEREYDDLKNDRPFNTDVAGGWHMKMGMTFLGMCIVKASENIATAISVNRNVDAPIAFNK